MRLADGHGLMIQNGARECIFKATIIPCSKHPYEIFALLVQLSHVAGDGATFYKLHNMLCSIDIDEEQEHIMTTVMLNPIRIFDSQEKKPLSWERRKRDILFPVASLYDNY